ncbi:50S ribosomal protein L10 [Candidatus Omnitrophota bacterium]
MKKLGIILRESVQEELKKNLEDNNNALILTYASIAASDFSQLRMTLRESGARLSIVKNSLAKRVFEEVNLSETLSFIDGPTAIVWGVDDPVIISKALVKFAKEHQGLVFRGGYLDRRVIGQEEVARMADLPTKEVLQAMAVNAIKYPISGLLNALTHNLRTVMNLLKKIGEEKGGS